MTTRRRRFEVPTAVALAAIVAISCLVFTPSLRGEFVSDDRNAILTNEYVISGDTGAGQIFTNYSWWGASRAESPGYRPLVTWSFARTYSLHGASVYPYHLTNFLLHGLVSALVLLLALALGAGRLGACGAAALFAVLPIHTEAVAWVVGRAEMMAAIGFAGALLAILRFRERGGAAYPIAAALLLFFGLLSKENAITLLACPVFLALLYPLPGHTAIRPGGRDAIALGALVAGVVVYFAVRVAAADGLLMPEYRNDLLDNPLSMSGPWSRIAGCLAILGRYLALTVWPNNLSIDYAYDATGIGAQFYGDGYSLFAVATCAGLAWVGYRARREQPIVAFGLLTAAAAYSIVSNTVVLIGTLMGERLFYLPTLGLCLATAPLFERAFQAFTPRVATALVCAPLVAYGLVSYRRAEVWRSPVALFESAATAYPRSARAHMELGSAYSAAGRSTEAVRAFEKAMEIHPAYGAAAYNLGNLHAHANRLGEAAAAYQRALDHSPALVQAWYNLALVRQMQNRPQDAIEAFDRAAELAPNDPVSQQSLADALLGMGRNEQAVVAYDRALAAGAPPQSARLNRGVARQRSYGCQSALEDYLAVLRDNPGNQTARSNALACLQQTGRYEEARQIAGGGNMPATRGHVANPETGR